jgi:hypothetical protein
MWYVNSKWDELLAATLGAAFHGDFASLGINADTTFMTDVAARLAISTCGMLDLYAVVPTSFPWLFALLPSASKEDQKDIVQRARQEWRAVLTIERDRPNYFVDKLPVVCWQSYRELMGVWGLRIQTAVAPSAHRSCVCGTCTPT